jgi:hypothetical protein
LYRLEYNPKLVEIVTSTHFFLSLRNYRVITYFIAGLPKLAKNNDAIMVVVEKLSKVVHFVPIKSTCKAIDIDNIFMKEIFRLHGMHKEIISDRDTNFTSIFCKSLMVGFETK